jgi:transcriptional regulator with XRE-family HTH domain
MSVEERQDFSERLQQALRDADYTPDSPTQLAREFNIRFSGRPVTVHAARKWLVGEAIPTQEKLRTLSHWLGVPADWLRFGTTDAEASQANEINSHSRLQPKDLAIIENLQRLDDKHRHIVRELIRLLVQAETQK